MTFIFLAACSSGGGSNTASVSLRPESISNGGRQPTPGGEGGVGEQNSAAQVTLNFIDPLAFTLTDVDYVMEDVAQTGGSTTAFVNGVGSLTPTEFSLPDCTNLGSIDCKDQNGRLRLACTGKSRIVKVKRNGRCLKEVAVDCTQTYEEVLVDNQPQMFAYSVNSVTNEIVGHHLIADLDIDPVYNKLEEFSRLSTGGRQPTKIISHPTGNMFYVLNRQDRNISMFHVSGISGQVTAVPNREPIGAEAIDIVMHESGKCVFSNNLSGSFSTFTVSRSGFLKRETMVNLGEGNIPTSIVFSPNGGNDAYVALKSAEKIVHYSVNVETCNLEYRDEISAVSLVGQMVLSADGKALYAIGLFTNSFSTYTLDSAGSFVADSGTMIPDDGREYEEALVMVLGGTTENPIVNIQSLGIDVKEFFLDPNGVFAYSTNIYDSTVQAYRVGEDCSLNPWFSTTQGGDSLGVIINMANISTPQFTCKRAIFSPGSQARESSLDWTVNPYAESHEPPQDQQEDPPADDSEGSNNNNPSYIP